MSCVLHSSSEVIFTCSFVQIFPQLRDIHYQIAEFAKCAGKIIQTTTNARIKMAPKTTFSLINIFKVFYSAAHVDVCVRRPKHIGILHFECLPSFESPNFVTLSTTARSPFCSTLRIILPALFAAATEQETRRRIKGAFELAAAILYKIWVL